MTVGALIFAFDNEATDFVAMANWSAVRIKHFLDLPTAIVTDRPDLCINADRVITVEAQSGGHRWFEDYDQTVTWYNAARTDAYALSPWDQTLVLDADYVVNSAMLRSVLDTDQDFLCFDRAVNIGQAEHEFMPGFGRYNLPMSWATVMAFRKTAATAWIFQSMTMIRQHWQHYRDLYGIGETNYRNDYALSIALALVNGSSPSTKAIPWPMFTVLPSHKLTVTELDELCLWHVEYRDSDGTRRTTAMSGMDFHAMGKRDLGAIVESHPRAGLSHTSTGH